MGSRKVIVIGASIAGTAISYFLSKSGIQVVLIEREIFSVHENVEDTWELWNRKGTPHAIHSHILLPRLINILKKDAPELVNNLIDSGACVATFENYASVRFPDYQPEVLDDDMTVLKCRRIILENESRKLLRAYNVEIIDEAKVDGLLISDGAATHLAKVTGLKYSKANVQQEIHGDFVIDASGRRTQIKQWLSAYGINFQSQIQETCGIFYTTQWFRLKDNLDDESLLDIYTSQITGAPYYESCFISVALVFADNRYFSITVTAQKDDANLRKLSKKDNWQTLVNSIEDYSKWISPKNSDEITDIITFGDINNTYSPLLANGVPVIENLFNLGDALCTTNPAAGRGCSIAWWSAYQLAQLIHQEVDYRKIVSAYYSFFETEVMPTIKASINKDRLDINNAKKIRDSLEGAGYDSKHDESDMGLVMTYGLKHAANSDIALYRKFMRAWFLLAGPETLLTHDVIVKSKAGLQEYIAEGKKFKSSTDYLNLITILRAGS